MRSWLAGAIVSLVVIAASATAVHAQVGSVRGKVVDSTGAGIPGALLAVDRTAVRGQTNNTGSYTLVGVPAGVRTIRAQIIGYAPVTVDVTVKANETVSQD